jgi:hypothetical protein
MMYRSESDKDVPVPTFELLAGITDFGGLSVFFSVEPHRLLSLEFLQPSLSFIVLLQLQLYIYIHHPTQPLPLTSRSSRCAGSLTIIHPPLSYPDPLTYTYHSPVKLHIHNAPCYQPTLADYFFVSSTLSVRSDASCTDHSTSRHV